MTCLDFSQNFSDTLLHRMCEREGDRFLRKPTLRRGARGEVEIIRSLKAYRVE